MIDIHCHIVPGVDDGPVTIEEAEIMLEMLYSDGTRAVIATSHRNHPMDFKPTDSYESSLERLRELAEKKYPELKIYRGAELYVRDDYLEVLDSAPYDFTLNCTKYVLIEFSTDAEYYDISNGVYEFSIRGYIPVLAHIDKYESIINDFKLLDELRRDGAYFQITGATLIGKYGKKMMKRMRKLTKLGYVDFIGSDGHSVEKRRPILKRAYDVVVRDCSKAEAERIFRNNPEALLEGKTIPKISIRKPLFGIFYNRKI